MLSLNQFAPLQLGPSQLLLAFVSLGFGYLVCKAFFNAFLHPLRKYPGPKLWAVSGIPRARMILSGEAHKKILELHQKYGDVVRVSPNELSYVSSEAWKDIMGHRKHGQGENGKDPVFWQTQPQSVIAANRENHGRMRKILSHGFSAQSMLEQQPLIQKYVNLLIQRLHENCDDGQRPLDMVTWYNWTTFDIIGDLTFGEPFGCLENSYYHPWVKFVFDRVKGATMITNLSRFPLGKTVVDAFIPKRLLENFHAHLNLTKEKVAKRMQMDRQRSDFMDAMMKADDKQKLSHAEIVGNSSILIIAGSETTATTLSGVTFLLSTHPVVLKKLTEEVRSSFTSEHEIDLLSVQKLSYMMAVLNESIRIYPPVPTAIPRKTQAGGDTICGHPSNFTLPDSFIPERWLGDPRFTDDSNDALQPFSFGPRNCIGKNLAYAEMRLILAKVIWNFDIQIDTNSLDWLEQNEAYFLWQKPALYIHLTPRTV
ncbi:related to Isotrichodermin C-15 hydroxylase [Fusarium oxysporum]|uniref:Related to Isotrichodermin C-15 hydroxylase n=1 Tax=Fusarium oxysporum TaxID=5507 RepID=A0A2H3UBQ4_FUSOX|nr:related to Isotrichodermin C-15 hydroxylase [Fusarium oxysporum]